MTRERRRVEFVLKVEECNVATIGSTLVIVLLGLGVGVGLRDPVKVFVVGLHGCCAKSMNKNKRLRTFLS